MKDLPIDVLPGTDPPKFKWQHTVQTPAGPKTVECGGSLPNMVENAVVELIAIARQRDHLLAEVDRLTKQIEGLMERVAKQSDQLGKNAERAKEQVVQPQQVPAVSSRRGRG